MKKFGVASVLCFGSVVCGGLLFSGCGKTSDIASITVTTLPTTEYVVGNYLDLTGGKFTAVCDNGKKLELELGLASVDAGRLDTVGEHTITVIYANKKSTFKVTVKKAKYEISLPTITVPYNGRNQGIDADSFKNQVALGSGMDVQNEDITYKSENSEDFVATLPKNVGNYKVKIHVNGGENYEDSDIIADYIITKADFKGYKNQNLFQYAKSVFANYGTDYEIANLWLQDASQNPNAVYNLNEVRLSQTNQLSSITLTQADMQSDEEMQVKYNVYDSEHNLLENITNIQSLDVGNYTIETICSTNTGNFNVYRETTNLSINKKQLILEQDFDVKISYVDVNGQIKDKDDEDNDLRLIKKESPNEYSGQFTDVKENFQIEIKSNISDIPDDAFSFDLEYGDIPLPNMASNRNKIVRTVDKTGEYCLRISHISKNYEYVGAIIFTVVISQ